MSNIGAARLKKEISMLVTDPPPGVCCWTVGDRMNHIQAQILGPPDTPYEEGTFIMEMEVPQRYPFEPPAVRFLTPVLHPNIDNNGRICLDTLKMKPAGSWAPSINISTLLTTIRTLLAHPNGDDGLMPDITELFRTDRRRFDVMARDATRRNATAEAATDIVACSSPQSQFLDASEIQNNEATVAKKTIKKRRLSSNSSSTNGNSDSSSSDSDESSNSSSHYDNRDA